MVFKEINALKNLRHKNIIQIFDCFFLKQMSVILVLEYFSGDTLLKYLKGKEGLYIGEEEAQKYFKQLLDGVSYCHRENLIHRDLKLENMMFNNNEDKVLKILDFGICGSNGLIALETTEMGSLRYLAPEVILNQIKAQPSIDV